MDWFLTASLESNSNSALRRVNEDTNLGHEEVSGFTRSSFLITWGHEKANGFTKSSFLIIWGHIEVSGFIGIMDCFLTESLQSNSNSGSQEGQMRTLSGVMKKLVGSPRVHS